MKRTLGTIVLAMSIGVLIGCGQNNNPVVAAGEQQEFSAPVLVVRVNGDQITIKADGQEFSSLTDYQKYLSDSGKDLDDMTFALADGPENDRLVGGAQLIGGNIVGYYFGISIHRHFVRGCINRYCNHLNVWVHRTWTGTSKEIMNWHVCVWRDNGRLCAGVWEKVSGYCKARCSATLQEIKNAWFAAAAYVGLSYVVAWAIYYVVAPLFAAVLII